MLNGIMRILTKKKKKKKKQKRTNVKWNNENIDKKQTKKQTNKQKQKQKQKQNKTKQNRNRSIRIAQKSIERNLLNTNQIIKVLTEMFSTSCQESCSLCCKVFLEISRTLGLVLAKLDHK